MDAKLFSKCLNVTSFFEGNHGFGNVAINFDNQILSIGCLCFTVKSGLAKKLFKIVLKVYPNYLISLSEDAIVFVNAIMSDDYHHLLLKQNDPKWIEMVRSVITQDIIAEIQEELAYKEFFIPAQKQAKLIKDTYSSIEFTDLLTIFCFDVLVQNGSFKNSIKKSLNMSDEDIHPYVRACDDVTSEKIILLKILNHRSMMCPMTYRKDVLQRKLAIIRQSKDTMIHGKRFNYEEVIKGEY